MLVNMKSQHGFLAGLGLLVVLSTACSKQSEVPPPPKSLPPLTVPTPVAVEPKEKPLYVYNGDHYRDIFMPVGASASYQAEGLFDPQKSSVHGIIFSPRYKAAVLTVMGSGTYFVKGGQIFDIMGKQVKGYSVKVLADRVIILSESDNTFEIKLKNDAEEAKTL